MKRSENGSALPLALLVLLLLSVLGVTLFSLGMTEVAIGTNWRAYSTAFYAADAGVDSGVVALRDLLSKNPSPTAADFQLISTPPAFLTAKNITPTTFLCNGAQVQGVCISTVLPAPGPYSYQTTFTSGPFTGLSGVATDYVVTAQMTGEGGTKANVTQTVQYVQVPLFQFGVFYGKGVDLEIEPGPAMTLNGRVFANSNVYIGANNSLTVKSSDPSHPASLKTAGKIYRTVKSSVSSFETTLNPITGTYDAKSYTFGAGSPANPDVADMSGTLHSLNFDSTFKPGGSSKWASSADWSKLAQSTFGGLVGDGGMGVSQITPPIPDLFNNPSNPDVVAHEMIEMPKGGDSAALKAAKLYTQAGLRIIDGVATDQYGNSVNLPNGTITTTTFYDAREGKTVNVYNVDIGKLNPSKPKNGIVYVASTAAPTSNTMPGVRLVNGSTLPPDGLTVVSQNPVYIQGDYNSSKNNNVNCGNCQNNHPPAAVLGDTVTVLSSNWGSNNSDTKGNQSTNNRPGAATTVNAALMTGPSAESKSGSGNGQLENDIRFLEDWNGAKFTYSGSIVSLWHSLQATKPWVCCGSGAGQYYTPPTRNWSYDTLFDQLPPPGTPSGVIMMKGQWAQQ